MNKARCDALQRIVTEALEAEPRIRWIVIDPNVDQADRMLLSTQLSRGACESYKARADDARLKILSVAEIFSVKGANDERF